MKGERLKDGKMERLKDCTSAGSVTEIEWLIRRLSAVEVEGLHFDGLSDRDGKMALRLHFDRLNVARSVTQIEKITEDLEPENGVPCSRQKKK